MRPELLEAKLLKMETFDAVVDAEVMEKEILPRQRLVNDAIAEARLKEGVNKRSVRKSRDRYDEEQLALIGKAKSLRGQKVRVIVEKGYVVDIQPNRAPDDKGTPPDS